VFGVTGGGGWGVFGDNKLVWMSVDRGQADYISVLWFN